jgi:hypothetical protein
VKNSPTFKCELIIANHNPLCLDLHSGVEYVYSDL